ncbi:His-Me finger endonuclease [Aspergillus novofumigatus IBT 16806]|uniref:His-Me finger endonuclease n=1 Tax=Aspergillus novofumigatus (strain IBT 16806) TaxID=1392255 RepID=A0A2I1BX78_ASPN1|nr:His-Me finger endonuclease [Aspergillus novofumigatus IBT 16806]PKX89967.1 His-Me finger endonuclease [Aspergillus novofumigatus IBT 16806]
MPLETQDSQLSPRSASLSPQSALLIQSNSDHPELGVCAPSTTGPTSSSPALVMLPKYLHSQALATTLEPKRSSPNRVDPAGILKYGNPGPVNDELKGTSLYGAYNRRTRNPYWVAEHMTPESISRVVGQRKNNFREDESIPAAFRRKVKDYTKSGSDRGHLEAADETFRMSNMCSVPKLLLVSIDTTAPILRTCKNLTTKYPSVRVITGPLYLPEKGSDGKWRVNCEVIENPPKVTVPTHFYKIIFGKEKSNGDHIGGEVAVGAFVLPNGQIDIISKLADYGLTSDLEFAQNLKTSQQRRLCEEVKCDISIKDFSEAVDEVTEMALQIKL